MGYSVVDLFCGGGGFSLGFEASGFNVKLALDFDWDALETFSHNFPGVFTVLRDIRSVHAEDFLRILDGRPDVVIGSPPCEPYSSANFNRRSNPLDRLYVDEVGLLVLHFIRLVGDLEPKVFVLENVPQLMSGELRWMLEWEFARVGYDSLWFNVLRAQDYGTPSRRVRVFISNIPLKPKKKRKVVTVWEAIKDLPSPSQEPLIPNHEPPPNISQKKLKRILRLHWGSSLILYEGAEGRRLPNLIKLHPNKIAPTVLGSSRFIHPYEPRLLTVREQARLMGFPDYHIFLGGKDEQYNQVGEAVPPPLARAIAEEVLKYL